MEILPWGTLTGIRPAKVAEKLLASGNSEESVIEALVQNYQAQPDKAALCIETAKVALALKKTLNSRDVALYVGIPFCPTRCAYCSFVSNSVERSYNLIEPFIKTLINEIETLSGLVEKSDLSIISVYIGGGTPTSLSENDLETIMSALKKSFDFRNLREYTVEAGRPDTISEKKLEIITQLGANRICINPQSMSEDVLKKIGRNHSTEDVTNAVKLMRQAGKNLCLNMDIIAGLPGDTPGGFCKTLDRLLELEPENITVHTLSLKKGSKLMLEKTAALPGEKPVIMSPTAPVAALSGNIGEMLDYASKRLRECGYAPYYVYRQKYISGGYENTGWSLPGYEGIYNVCMMEELCTVLALGGGGVTKLVTTDGRIERVFNAKYPREYIMMTDKIKDKMGRVREYAVSIL